jgi:hypothetical protein
VPVPCTAPGFGDHPQAPVELGTEDDEEMKRIRQITAEEENFRLEPFGPGALKVRRDGIPPVPVGAIVAKAFLITGYDRDVDGSLMARLAAIDSSGEATGWEVDRVGLYPDSAWELDGPSELADLAEADEE